MKIQFTARAQRRAAIVGQWWLEHRPAAPQLFAQELADVVELLSTTPRAGVVYRTKGDDVIRRVLLRRTEQHVYYVIDERAATVRILTLWGARRRSGPRL